MTLDDGTHKIVLNTQGKNGDACNDVVDFLRLIEGVGSDNPLIKQIEHAAEEIKDDEIWREKRMQSIVRDQDTFDRGFDRGIEQKALDVARNLLTMNIPIEDVAKATGLSIEALQLLV